jgi:hypothetical protein
LSWWSIRTIVLPAIRGQNELHAVASSHQRQRKGDAMSNAGLSAASINDPGSGKSLALQIHPSGARRRRSPRIANRQPQPGVLSWREGNTETVEPVLATTISRFGCALRSRAFLRPGTRVRLDFSQKSIEGRVAYSLKDHSNNLVTMGVAYDHDGGELWQLGFAPGVAP